MNPNQRESVHYFSDCQTNVLLYCIVLCYFPLFYGRNDFPSNFSPGVFWCSVYISQPYTSVLYTNLIQLGDARQWLTLPQTQHSARGLPTMRKCCLFHCGVSDIFKGVYPPPMCEPPFPKGGSAGEVKGDEDNDASGSTVADTGALYRAACDESLPPLHCTPQR